MSPGELGLTFCSCPNAIGGKTMGKRNEKKVIENGKIRYLAAV
jgi:hypothetical protein